MNLCCLDMGKFFNFFKTSSKPEGDETNINETPKDRIDPTAFPNNATMETLMSSAAYEDARESERPEEIDRILKATGELACANLRDQFLDESDHWSVWTEKKGLKIEITKVCQSGSICGRGIYEWNNPPADMDINFVLSVMWHPDTKKKYDENTDKMVLFFNVDDDTNLTCQAFKGRYGFSGRYFHVVIQKKLVTEACGIERLYLAARSAPEEILDAARAHIEADEAAVQLSIIEKTQVRGFAHVAGIVIERIPDGGVDNGPRFRIGYVNDADIVTVGVPRWIIDRVKSDQLGVVKNIPSVLMEAWALREVEH